MFSYIASYFTTKLYHTLQIRLGDSLSDVAPLPQPDPYQSHLDQSQVDIRHIDRKKTALYDDMMVYDQVPQGMIHLILDINCNWPHTLLSRVFDTLIHKLPTLRGKGYQTIIYTPDHSLGYETHTITSLQSLNPQNIKDTGYQSILTHTCKYLQGGEHSTIIIVSDMLDYDPSIISILRHQHKIHTIQIPLMPFGGNYRARELKSGPKISQKLQSLE